MLGEGAIPGVLGGPAGLGIALHHLLACAVVVIRLCLLSNRQQISSHGS